MIVDKIEIRNFRSLLEVDLDCENLTTIIGRNGSGKSSLLRALDVFYDVSYQATPYDYFSKDTNSEITIRVTYGDLRQSEVKEFGSLLSGEKLIVTKRINAGGAKYYGASKQLLEFSDFRKLPIMEKRQKLNELINSGNYSDLSGKATSDAVAEKIMYDYEMAHPKLLVTVDREQQFFGPKNIGGGKLDNFTKFVLIPAVRDASSEAERRGVILQLIDALVARSVNARPDVRQLNEDFERRVKEIYNPVNLTELGELAATITKLLAQYAPGAELDLTFGEVLPPKINFPTALASLVEDNFKCPISYSGHGLQRVLILALLQQLSLTTIAEVTGQDQPEEKKGGVEGNGSVSLTPDLILAIEEPELYQHPARSRFLAGVLYKLTKLNNEQEPRTQVLYATHSPYFIDLKQFDRVRLARKLPVQGTDTLQSKFTTYKWSQAIKRLSDVSGKDPSTFTYDSFVAHASPVMNSVVNEGFFAEVVMVVEGLGDVGTFWAIQELLGKKWEALNIVVVPAGGKNNIDRPVIVFEGLGIPTYFVFDGDSKLLGKERQKTGETNKRYLKLAGVKVEDFPATQVNNKWAVFEDKLETELKKVGEEYFNKLMQEIGESLGLETSRVLKNSEGAAQFIKKTYADGKQFPLLEEIINCVTALRH